MICMFGYDYLYYSWLFMSDLVNYVCLLFANFGDCPAELAGHLRGLGATLLCGDYVVFVAYSVLTSFNVSFMYVDCLYVCVIVMLVMLCILG